MNIIYKYPLIYKWSIVISFIVPISIGLLMIPSFKKNGINNGLLLVLSLCFIIVLYGLFLQIRRFKEPKEIHISNNEIAAIFQKKDPIKFKWENIADVIIEKNYRGVKVTITSQFKGNKIVFYDDLNGFEELMQTINNKADYQKGKGEDLKF